MMHQFILSGRSRRMHSGAILLLVALLSIIAIGLPALNVYKINNSSIGSIGSINILRRIRGNDIDRFGKAGPRGRSLSVKDVGIPQINDPSDIPSDIPSRLPVVVSRQNEAQIAPYSLADVLRTATLFKDTFAVVVYDPPTDTFIAHYSDNMRWISSCHKLVKSFKMLANSLRLLFPNRFNAEAPEFALAMSSADYPGIKWDDCLRSRRLDCTRGEDGSELSPILQFGSAFRLPLLPTMIPMPMPQTNHLPCYHTWILHHLICQSYLPRGPENADGLVFPEHVGVRSWDELVPQVVWRGTDFSYLHKMEPSLRMPNFDMDVASQIDLSGRVNKQTAATHAMRQVYEELLPRWKGVVLTAEAEREAEAAHNKSRRERRLRKQKRAQEQPLPPSEPVPAPVLPWANIKFAGAMYQGKKTHTSEIPYYQQFEEFGIPAVGEGMSLETLGLYRYHIDIGGGGGTTWSGTLEKLALPGLLFHHVTPTKDYFHDKLVPWVHYVPVVADLSDLREKYEWAETHPQMAQQISENAIEFARSLGTPEGFEGMFQEFYENPLRKLIEAYQPVEGVDWREAMTMTQWEGEKLTPFLQCAGYYTNNCDRLVEGLDYMRLHDRDTNMSA